MTSVQPGSWTVGKMTLSGLEARPRGPARAAVIALHGGGYSAGYWNDPVHPHASLLEVGAMLGYHVVAVDRPGYGDTFGLVGDAVRQDRQAEVICALAEQLRSDHDAVFVIGHSVGAQLAVYTAAAAEDGLLDAIEFSGLPLDFRQELVDREQLAALDHLPATTGEFRRELFFGPDGTFDPAALDYDQAISRLVPAAEIIDSADCPEMIPVRAPKVRVPVQVTMAEFENSSHGGREVMERCASLFTGSPRVVTNWQVFTGHNISLHKVAAAYHLRALAFFDEVLVTR